MKPSEFKAKFADYAMLQQIRYGIPASVTLAQCAIESGWGDSEGARKDNIYFGVKAQGWHGESGKVAYYDDDKPNEAFCVYSSAEASFEDHSRFLMENKRYSGCFSIPIENYTGWLNQLQASKYATSPTYAKDLAATISSNGFAEYDQKATEIANKLGVQCGYARKGGLPNLVNLASVQNPSLGLNVGAQQADNRNHLTALSGNFAMPLDFTKPGVQITGDFHEKRSDHVHQGLDIATNQTPIPTVATEDNGKVVSVKPNNGNAGNMVVVEYDRPEGKIRTTYMHLSKIDVKTGDTVKAGSPIGQTGKTGHSTGIHLHFEVAQCDKDGKVIEKLDPTKYLAELQVRSGQSVALKDKDGKGDYLAAARSTMTMDPVSPFPNSLAAKTGSNDPKKWLEALMLQNNDLDPSKDLVSALISQYATSLIISLVKIKDAEAAEAMEKENKEIAERQPERANVHVARVQDTFKMVSQLSSQNYETIMPQQENKGIGQKV